MITFIDTSAILALLATNDPQHQNAVARYASLLETPYSLVTTNYVVVETIALVQKSNRTSRSTRPATRHTALYGCHVD